MTVTPDRLRIFPEKKIFSRNEVLNRDKEAPSGIADRDFWIGILPVKSPFPQEILHIQHRWSLKEFFAFDRSLIDETKQLENMPLKLY